jgi:hypothetical protein
MIRDLPLLRVKPWQGLVFQPIFQEYLDGFQSGSCDNRRIDIVA